MSSIFRGVSVDSLRKAVDADPHSEPNLTLVRGLRSYEDEGSNWAADKVVKILKKKQNTLQVSDVSLPSYQLLGGVTNDPEDDNFSPLDEYPEVEQDLKNGDMLVFASTAIGCFPDANTVRLCERLRDAAKVRSKANPGERLFEGQAAAVVVHGGLGAQSAANGLASFLNYLGLTVVRRGIVSWDSHRGKVQESDEFANTLDDLAANLHMLCKALRE